jgi:hypothetical protein
LLFIQLLNHPLIIQTRLMFETIPLLEKEFRKHDSIVHLHHAHSMT